MAYTALINGIGSVMEIIPQRRELSGLKHLYYKPSETVAASIERDWKRVGQTMSEIISKNGAVDDKKDR